MTLQEIEAACDAGELPDSSRHSLEAPSLPLKKMFYPLGFPAEVRTNSSEVLVLMDDLWGQFKEQHNTEPIISEVHVVESGDSTECPPAPVFRYMMPLILAVANGDNYSVVDLERKTTRISITRDTLRYGLYAKYFLLGNPGCCISANYATPVHAGCVALDGSGVLLCGDSGAGKSTLSYACARAGWTYVTDDGSYLLNGGTRRVVTGDCYKIRLRPTAAELFPEIVGLEITPRAAGKPSVELPTTPMRNIVRAQTMEVDFIVFLNRLSGEAPKLVPFRKDVAREFMLQDLLGLPATRAEQHAAIEELLKADLFELRCSDLDWAVNRLETLVQERR